MYIYNMLHVLGILNFAAVREGVVDEIKSVIMTCSTAERLTPVKEQLVEYNV